jgi:hypothetical protein
VEFARHSECRRHSTFHALRPPWGAFGNVPRFTKTRNFCSKPPPLSDLAKPDVERRPHSRENVLADGLGAHRNGSGLAGRIHIPV